MGACTWGRRIDFHDSMFRGDDQFYIRGSVVHELGHVINNTTCLPGGGLFCGGVGFGIPDRSHHITDYGDKNSFEYWAEAVTDWVYGTRYKTEEGRNPITSLQADYIQGVFRP